MELKGQREKGKEFRSTWGETLVIVHWRGEGNPFQQIGIHSRRSYALHDNFMAYSYRNGAVRLRRSAAGNGVQKLDGFCPAAVLPYLLWCLYVGSIPYFRKSTLHRVVQLHWDTLVHCNQQQCPLLGFALLWVQCCCRGVR